MSNLTKKVGLAAGSVKRAVDIGRKANIADFKTILDDRSLYISSDVQQELMGLIERLFDQRVNIERDQEITIPVTDIEKQIIDIICTGQYTNRGALFRGVLHDAAGRYHHKYKNER